MTDSQDDIDIPYSLRADSFFEQPPRSRRSYAASSAAEESGIDSEPDTHARRRGVVYAVYGEVVSVCMVHLKDVLPCFNACSSFSDFNFTSSASSGETDYHQRQKRWLEISGRCSSPFCQSDITRLSH